MTRTEYINLDLRKLSDKAQDFIGTSDQSVYEIFKDVDKNDYETINKIAESWNKEVTQV